MKRMTDEILSLVKKNLPEATALALKDYLADAENNKEKSKQLEKDIEHKRKTISENNGLIVSLKEKLDSQEKQEILKENNDKKFLELEEKERNLYLKIARIQRDEAIKQAEILYKLVDKVFGHPSVTIATHKKIPLASHFDNNGNPKDIDDLVDVIETVKTTESKE